MSSNTNIGNTPVNQGYVQLIHTGETGGIDGTLRTLYDGDGTASDLQIASNKVKVSTELYIGSDTLQEYIQDTVGAMLVTNASHTNLSAAYDDAGDGAIDLTATGEVTLTGTQTLSNKTLASPTFTGTANGANLTLTGDLTVSGDTIFTNSNNVLIGDAILTLNADETGSPTANAGFEVERGTSTNKSFVWNETDDKWTIGSETFVAGTVEANLTGNVTGSASLNLLTSNNLSDLANAATARTNLGVDAAGTDNSTDVTLAGSLDYITLSGQEITRNAINLTTDVTGTLPVANGGTGLTSISTLLNSNVTPSSLGLVIGTDVQAYDAELADIAAIDTSTLTGSDNDKFIAWSFSSAGFVLSSFPATQMSGSTNNGLLTYNSQSVASVESNLTFDASSNLDLLSDSGKLRIGAGNDLKLYHNGTNDIIESGGTAMLFKQGTAERIKFNSAGNIQFNNSQADINTRFATTGGLYTLWVDGGTDRVGIGTNSPQVNLDVTGSNGGDHALGLRAGDTSGTSPNSSQIILSYNGNAYNSTGYAHSIRTRHNAGAEAGNSIQFWLWDQGTDTASTLGSKHVMSIEGNGRIGIGTQSPSTKMHIKDASNNVDLRIETDKVNGNAQVQYLNDARQYNAGINNVDAWSVYDATAGATRFSINSSGNVGIGTTSPADLLHIADTVSSNALVTMRVQNSLGYSEFGTQSNYARILSNGTLLYAGTASVHYWYMGGSAQMALNSTGLGIGTSSPSVDLHVLDASSHAQLRIETDSASHGAYLELESTTNKYQIYNVGGDLGIDESGVATRLTIKDSTGSVLIGTTNTGWDGDADNLVVGSGSGNNGMTIYAGSTNFSQINFADSNSGAGRYTGVLRYTHSNNSMSFHTNDGAERMRINSSGNVGIGVTSPDTYNVQLASGYKIGVDTSSGGTTRIAEIEFYNGADGSLRLKTDNASTGGIEFHTEGSKRLEVTRGGDVSITASSRLYFDSGVHTYIEEDIGDRLRFFCGGAEFMRFTEDTSDTLALYTNNTAAITIDNSQNVGIGETSIDANLHITGSPVVIKMERVGQRAMRMGTPDNSSNFVFADADDLKSNQRMVIDNTGNVLIGGTSASGHGFNLEVLNDHVYVKGPDGWNGTGDKAIVALGSGVSNESFGCGYVYGTGLVLSTYKLSGGGDFGSSTQNSLVIADTTGQASFINDVIAYASSDKRLKENVKPLDNALDKINKINGVEFDWIDGKDEHGNSVHSNEGHDVGVIAQEIEKVLPEVVHTRENGYKAVKYEKIVPLLIQAIKEQQKQIEELKNG